MRGEARIGRDDCDGQSVEDIVPDSSRPICCICFDQDGVMNSDVVEKVIGHPVHSSRY